MKPGVKPIIAGIGLFILGGFVIPLAIVLPLVLGDSDEKQFIVPGTVKVAIEEPGCYYLWNDHQTIFEGKSYNRSESIPDGIEIRITNVETGELFDFVASTSISVSSGSSSKNSIGYIEAQSPVRVDIEIAGGSEERVFSFSRAHLWEMIGLIFGGIVLAIVAGLAGAGITVWGIVKLVRSSEKGGQAAPSDA